MRERNKMGRETGEGQKLLLEGDVSSSFSRVLSRADWGSAPPLPWTAPFPAAAQRSELSTLVISPLLTAAGLAPLSPLLWTSASPGCYERRTWESDLPATAICLELLFIILWTPFHGKDFRSRINTIQVWEIFISDMASYLSVVNWKKKMFQ